MPSLTSRIIAFAARISDGADFSIPNSGALAAVGSRVGAGRTMTREGFDRLFRDARRHLPKPPEAVEMPAVLDYNGVVHRGPSHALIGAEMAQRLGGTEKAWGTVGKFWPSLKKGFTTSQQPFVSRGEAKQIAQRSGLRLKPRRGPQAPGLHSEDLQ